MKSSQCLAARACEGPEQVLAAKVCSVNFCYSFSFPFPRGSQHAALAACLESSAAKPHGGSSNSLRLRHVALSSPITTPVQRAEQLSVSDSIHIDYVKLRSKPKQNTKLKTRCYIGPNLVSATCSLMWPRQQSINLNVACCCFLAAFYLHLLQTTLKYCGHQHSKPLQQSAQIRSLQPEHQMTG